MLAFAGNSLLCRQALQNTDIDPASFTSIRIVSGAIALWLIVGAQRRGSAVAGSWLSALALFGYAVSFSFAYVTLSAGTGALLLFGAVQATMIGYGLASGERLRAWQAVGLLLAIGGLVGLLMPGLSAPPMEGAALMLLAGVAWGIYSLRGKAAGDATRATAGNFMRAVLLATAWSAVTFRSSSLDSNGIGYAIMSGAFTSGIGYAIWYMALGGLNATTGAVVQLSVPVIAAAGGVALLGERVTLRLLVTSAAILGGIAMVMLGKTNDQ
jgi:drug/metabolite transporter (DMT)-like permease